MHVGDTIFIFCLALIIFGPKKLPEIGRQIGKLMVEFRRASNEFKMQIEEELRASEETERQKEINAAKTMLPATAPVAALPELATASADAGAASAPVIAPPSTGLPVNRTFDAADSTAGTCGYQATAPTTAPEADAYPETGNGFNAGLNTASNAVISETPDALPINSQPEVVEAANVLADHAESAPAQAPVHHG
jgi:sec-independent protein translocase protein TatB